MREILSLISRPSHYAGIEDGITRKDPKDVHLHIALAFPDLYEVGMSYLGQKIIYGLVNSKPHWLAERVMAPEKETGELLRAKKIPLATIETDTNLKDLDCVGFSITHELAYTNVLYMLDLAQIPLRSLDRSASLDQCPLIVAGGGAVISAEPLAPFIDLMVLGDGEETFPKILTLLEDAKKKNLSRLEFLKEAQYIKGAYVPSFFDMQNGHMVKKEPNMATPVRAIVADLNQTPYPTKQVVPVGAVHNRLSLEIARGCTRGCRFCQAGMVYRPVRERSVENIQKLVTDCLKQTGFDEISFLALSSGDYSALKTLSHSTLDRCQEQQISLCLPSQRVGSIDDEIIARMADLRRTGMTLAPEAGSQRLRDVINKGITEEEIILHAQKLVEHGWRLVKLYFMIGLPTETDEDLLAIVDLCAKVRDAAGKGSPRLQVTAALSPFVPKPFTPFQWAEQISQEEIVRRIQLVREAFKGKKCLQMRWHEPAVSHLEGILSRSGREMADVVEKAYKKGAIFTSWMEHFNLEPWLAALEECNLNPSDCIRARNLDEVLPWDHIECGVSKKFLAHEYKLALEEKITSDCRYAACHACGCCDLPGATSPLHGSETSIQEIYKNSLIFPQRDQNAHQPHWDEEGKLILQHATKETPKINPKLTQKVRQYRIWHAKLKGAAFLSQLELQSVIERALRRAEIPVAFSMGFHPLPLLSFGRALPVGVLSYAEWFSISLCENVSSHTLWHKLDQYLPEGLDIKAIEAVDNKTRTTQASGEIFKLLIKTENAPLALSRFQSFAKEKTFPYTFQTKKGLRTKDIRHLLANFKFTNIAESQDTYIEFETNWMDLYISPIKLVSAILKSSDDETIWEPLNLIKIAQIFNNQIKAFSC